MKILVHSQKHQQGNVLIVCLVISAIIGVTLASYLTMTQAQTVSVARSQTWNTSITLAEAGVEDALALMNKFAGDYDNITNWCTASSLAADNWSVIAPKEYHVRRYIGGNYYDVYIQNDDILSPTIHTVGHVPWTFSYNQAPQSMFAAIGLEQNYATKMMTRKLEVSCKYDRLYNVAMAALQTIDLKGHNVATDSFDSADPAHSINGFYPTNQLSMIKSNGDVCSDATIMNSINVGNANIKGSARTGPNGTVYVGPNGYVTGGIYDDFNVLFPDVVLPNTLWVVPVYYGENSYIIDGYPYNYVFLTSGDYEVPGDFSNGIYVGTNAHVRLQVTTSVQIMNLEKDGIYIATGGSLQIYMVGQEFKIAGRGIVNQSGMANAFNFFGLPSCTSIKFNGNGAFTGGIYAPQAAFSLGGGGNDVYDFVGASVTKTVLLNGHFNFHYDENLRRVGPARGYVAKNWKEM